MAGITKKRYEDIQEAAMKLIASYGIKKLDAIDSGTRIRIMTGYTAQLQAQFGNGRDAARSHIAKACRRQRHPQWRPPENWGGARVRSKTEII